MLSIAMVLSYLEAILPPIAASVPGIKIGLPNIVVVFILYRYSPKEAFLISVVRVFLTALLFGNAMTLSYGLAGAVLSLATMVILKRIDIFSQIGVSVAGGVMHNMGQIAVAVILLNSTQIAYYALVLLGCGTVSGVAVGLAGSILMEKIPENLT